MIKEKALDMLYDGDLYDAFGYVTADGYAALVALEGVVLQERKTGKWVLAHPLQEDDGGAYVCSCCKSGSYEVIPKTWKACPWCTALMEVDE